MRKTLPATAGVTLVLLAACSSTPADPGTTTPTDPGSTTRPQPDQPPDGAGAVVDWNDPSKVADLGNGWTLAACEGDAPLLCVERNGSQVGVVEALAFPIESFDDLDPAADPDSNLTALAEGFFTAIREDRAAGCGSDYRFDPIYPEPFVLGNTPGLSYGFAGTMPNGDPSELNLQYATVVGDDIVSIVAAAYDQGGCPGRDDLSGFDSASLEEFRPLLEQALHESPLPDLAS